MLSVQAMVIDLRDNSVCPAFDVIHVIPLVIMELSQFRHKMTVYHLPLIVATDYLFKKHSDKGKEKWEIYAWAVRDIMSKASGLEKNDQPYREKLVYEAGLHGLSLEAVKEA